MLTLIVIDITKLMLKIVNASTVKNAERLIYNEIPLILTLKINMQDIELGFGNRLKDERKRLQLSQEKLAKLTGMKPLSISQYENGHSMPSVKFLFALERLEFDVMFILSGKKYDFDQTKITDDVVKKVTEALSKLENALGEKLEPVMKVKATNLLIQHFQDNKSDQNLSPMQILSKLI